MRKRWEQDRRLVSLLGDAGELGPAVAVNGNGSGFHVAHTNGNGNSNGNGHYAVPTTRDEFTWIDTVDRVRRGIATLPENYREVVVLCELEEMSYEEAATALGCRWGRCARAAASGPGDIAGKTTRYASGAARNGGGRMNENDEVLRKEVMQEETMRMDCGPVRRGAG